MPTLSSAESTKQTVARQRSSLVQIIMLSGLPCRAAATKMLRIVKYRYGFNGKENDDDFQDYGMRVYCPECGVFLSVDPIAAKYPELSPYQFASNTPIWAIDLDGLEAKYAVEESKEKTGYTLITLTFDVKVLSNSMMITKDNIDSYLNPMIDQTEKSFSLTDETAKIIYKAKVNIQKVDKVDYNKDYIWELTDKVVGSNANENTIGMASSVGNSNVNRMQIKVDIKSDEINRKKTASCTWNWAFCWFKASI